MIPCNELVLETRRVQTRNEDSFVGGKPKIPADEPLPVCRLCGAEQSFFFQVAFPADGDLGNLSLAVFACTSCADELHLIPEMLNQKLSGVDIPEGFLDAYQSNFRFLLFDTAAGQIRNEYVERVLFRPIRLSRCGEEDVQAHKVGGQPTWLIGDESPRSYAGSDRLVFAMQLMPDFHFPIGVNAPRQMELALDGSPEPADRDYYELFNGNALYLFATVERRGVYAVTQID